MAEGEVYQLLMHALNEDRQMRETAEQHLHTLKQTNFPGFLFAVTSELANPERNPHARRLAGVILKNSLDAKDDETKRMLMTNWLSLDPNFRAQLKALVIQTFASDSDARHQAAQVCAKIAVIEIPHGQWLDLIEGLLNNVSTPNANPFLIQSTLECLGYICEEIEMEYIRAQTNLILTAVVRGMRTESANQDIILAATNALLNALEFVAENFKNQDERTYIMQVVCETTQPPHSKAVRGAAFECLVKIAHFYYDYLPVYMQGIFNITLNAIRNEEEPVALQAIEFWSTICDEELEILGEIEDAAVEGRQPEQICQYFIKGALSFLIPVLTEALTKQEETEDEDAWNVAMAAGTCLGLISTTVMDDIVPHVLPFVTKHIQDENWRFREAATFAFGALLEGPHSETLEPYISGALPILLSHLKDQNSMVKDTSAWTIGRVCQLHQTFIYGHLHQLIHSLTEALNDDPKVAANACWAIHNIGLAYEKDEDATTSELSQYFTGLLQMLLKVTERDDASEANLGCAAYEAINILIQTATKDCIPLLNSLIPVLLLRLEQTFTIQVVTQEDREDANEKQALLCGTLQVATQKLGKLISQFADKMMSLYLQIFSNSKNNHINTVHEEALMAVGALANAMEKDFVKYLSALVPFLSIGLQNWEASTVCAVAVGVVGDLCRAVGKNITPYCDDLVTLLLRNLQNPKLNKDVKPPILSCFGDIALAIGGYFEKYLGVVIAMLQQASQTPVRNPEDYDEVEFVNSLREGIFETYTGIIQGLRIDNQASAFESFIEPLIIFIESVWDDPNRSDGISNGVIGVLGDLVQTFQIRVKPIFEREGIKKVVQECRESPDPKIKEIGKWTFKLVASLK